MMTPQEAESHVFSKASFGGGYNMAQVDTFLDTLIADYAALYKENAALKGKMKVLVDKIEEYRATEDAMRMTLLSAQKMADTMVKEAETKRAEAVAKAEAETKSRMEQINRELANEELRLTAARNSTTAYVNKLKELYTHELEYIGRLSEMTLAPGETMLQNDPVREIEDTVSKILVSVQEDAPAPAQEAAPQIVEFPTEEEAPEAEEKPNQAEEEAIPDAEAGEGDTVVFDRLQFGKDYDFE